jgi:hypothetical protein
MIIRNGDSVMTAMIRKSNAILANSMRRIEKTAELLDGSRAVLNDHGVLASKTLWPASTMECPRSLTSKWEFTTQASRKP